MASHYAVIVSPVTNSCQGIGRAWKCLGVQLMETCQRKPQPRRFRDFRKGEKANDEGRGTNGERPSLYACFPHI